MTLFEAEASVALSHSVDHDCSVCVRVRARSAGRRADGRASPGLKLICALCGGGYDEAEGHNTVNCYHRLEGLLSVANREVVRLHEACDRAADRIREVQNEELRGS